VVQQPVCNAGVLGDVADSRSVVPVIGEDADRRLENEPALVRLSD
jgi:hypothetical protein